MGLLTLVEPVSEPVSLADAKLYLRLDSSFTLDDPLVSSLITAARRWAEAYTQRRFLMQTMRLYMDYFPGYVDMKMAGQKVSSPFVSGANAVLVGIRYAILLPYPAVRSITLFQYLDQNGNATVLRSGTDYVQDLASQPARLMPTFGNMWPVARVIANAVQVDYVVGYGGTVIVAIANGTVAITSSYKFTPNDVGAAITIPGAGAAGVPLVTTVAAVDGSGNATVATAASTTVSNAAAYLGQVVPDGIVTAIKMLLSYWYELRVPADESIPMAVKALLSPYRDLRF